MFSIFSSGSAIIGRVFVLDKLMTKLIINEIVKDLQSDYKMFRLLQGDVGSGKTIISLITAANVIKSNWQVSLMAPTEILAKQHYDLALKIIRGSKANIEFFAGSSDSSHKKKVQKSLGDILKKIILRARTNSRRYRPKSHSIWRMKVFDIS